jgi:hypothetical protein
MAAQARSRKIGFEVQGRREDKVKKADFERLAAAFFKEIKQEYT